MNEYDQCLDALEAMEYHFSAFVVDGRRGVRHLLQKRYPETPIQFCQFHQVQIMKRYLPRRAKTQAAQQLRSLALTLSHTTRAVLEHSLSLWHEEHHAFLKEKTINPKTGRWQYTHRRLRSAYRSLQGNLLYLFTYQEHPELNIPNTTNHCDGLFSHIKQKVLIHRGISKSRRMKMIDYLLEQF
jgi:transposase-like protein